MGNFSRQVNKLLQRNERCYKKFKETFFLIEELIKDLEKHPSVENYKKLLKLVKKAKEIKKQFLEIESDYYKLKQNVLKFKLEDIDNFEKMDSLDLLSQEDGIDYDNIIRELQQRIKDSYI